jgi:C-terminal processing protease CtpA/Prc
MRASQGHLLLATVLALPLGHAFQVPARPLVRRGLDPHSSSPKILMHSKKQQQDHDTFVIPHNNTSNGQHALVTVTVGLFLALSSFCWSVPAMAVIDEDAFISSSSSSSSQTTANVKAGLSARRYWNIIASQDENAPELRTQANEGLLGYAVGVVNTMYYDNTGGVRFTPREFYNRWRTLRDETRQQQQQQTPAQKTLATREGAVQNLKWLIGTLNDPYSKYLTREELWQELNVRNDGFLGIGVIVEPPDQGDQFFARGSSPTLATVVADKKLSKKETVPLSAWVVQNLPVVTAVVPDSPAERSGITVGDRIVAVGEYSFLGQSRPDVHRNFQARFATSTNYYFGHSDLTLAKPVVRTLLTDTTTTTTTTTSMLLSSSATREREVVIGYRQTRVRLPTKSLEEEEPFKTRTNNAQVQQPQTSTTSTYVASGINGMGSDSAMVSVTLPAATPSPPTRGGNHIVHWELISGQQPSIFQRNTIMASAASSSDSSSHDEDLDNNKQKVGYIRLTRFSRASTAGYVEAVQALEDLGATSFIIDVRNNYGGIIQEAMLTASTLLRDPHAVLCYTMNARGGFTPHDVEEYVVDKRYPGYMLSSEPQWVTLHQVQRENPEILEGGWVPPSSYASLREQTAKLGLHRPSTAAAYDTDSNINVGDMVISPSFNLQWNTAAANAYLNHNQQWMAQRNVVVLINEGTASAAEVFASSLHDNGRTLALIGTKSYGKGLIQHTFPMPDGGGLRLTIAEYLTPSLRHVTVVGNAKFDRATGEQVGGGITPDLHCTSTQGIPSNIGADLCVGMALDVLDEAQSLSYSSQGQEKHHLQQHQKPRQQEEDLTKKGILALDSNAAGMNYGITATRVSTTNEPEVHAQALKEVATNQVSKGTVVHWMHVLLSARLNLTRFCSFLRMSFGSSPSEV